MINHVEEILNRSKEIHLKKREDYASDPTASPFENFDRSSIIATWFPNRYKSFAVLIGTKIARLGALLITGKTPNNESIDDTFLDLITYCALFYGYWKEKQIRESVAIEIGYDYSGHTKACKIHDGFICSCGAIYIPRT